jgi:dTDP-4-amino-4,6-dideoxygalactose transaminase
MNSNPIAKEPPLRLSDLRLRVFGGRGTFPLDAPRRRYFAYARNALHAALSSLRVGPGDEVLLPAFHCVSLVEPVVLSGASCRFYDVSRRFRIDGPSLERELSSRTRMLVVIHYFGFPQPLDRLRRMCDERNVVLVEDCCHALYSGHVDRPVGQDGHLALFSFRKTLPVVDGALLVANDERIALPTLDRGPGWRYRARVCKWTVDRLLRREGALDGEPLEPADERAPRPTIASRLADGSTADGWLYGYDVNPSLSRCRGTGPTCWIASRLDPESIRSARRRNYAQLLDRLGGAKRVRVPLDELPAGACPWTFPLDAAGIGGLDRKLRARGVPAFTFGEALHSALPEGIFHDAEHLALNLVQLPVHQGMTSGQLDSIAGAVRSTIGET